MSFITVSPNINNIQDTEKRFWAINLFLNKVLEIINGNIELTKNVKTKVVSVAFSAANTNQAVAHGLGFVPNGYVPISLSAAMKIYTGTTAATTNLIYLKSDAVGTAKVLFF